MLIHKVVVFIENIRNKFGFRVVTSVCEGGVGVGEGFKIFPVCHSAEGERVTIVLLVEGETHALGVHLAGVYSDVT